MYRLAAQRVARVAHTRALATLPSDIKSYTRGLFFGVVDDKKVFPYPDVLTEDERDTMRMLVDPVRRFFDEKVDSKKIDRESKIPDDVLSGLKELGVFGLQIPTELGGLGLSNTAYARVAEEVCRDGSIAVTLLAHQSIGLKGILLNGSDEQKAKYLPKLATGEHIAAFALTEPSAGSDAAHIKTRATLSPDGKHFLLNGSKIWISNGGWAHVFTVFAQTKGPDGQDHVTAFIVERAFGGVTHGKPEDKLGIRGSNTCEVFFENTPVPIENVLGGVNQGFKVAMNILNNGRFGLGAGAASQVKRMMGLITAHATTRHQFGHPLSHFGMIKEKIANMAIDAYAVESMAFMTTGMIDRGDPECYLEAAMCKVAGSEAAFRNIDACIQIMGGMGFMKSQPYEQGLRDARILSIFEGTNEILRMLVALEGCKAVGKRLDKISKDPANHVNEVVELAVNKAKSYLPLGLRVPGLKTPAPISNVHSTLAAEGRFLQDATAAFGGAIEHLLLKYKKDIINQQLELKRVANISIDLYATTAVLARATRALNREDASAPHEDKLARAFVEKATGRIRNNLAAIYGSKKADNLVQDIAQDIFVHQGYLPSHPTGI